VGRGSKSQEQPRTRKGKLTEPDEPDAVDPACNQPTEQSIEEIFEDDSTTTTHTEPDLRSLVDPQYDDDVHVEPKIARRSRSTPEGNIRQITDHPKFGERAGKRRTLRASSDKGPPSISGFNRRKQDQGWVYWKETLTPTGDRDRKGKIIYDRDHSYGVKIGKQTWELMRRYDGEKILEIIVNRIEQDSSQAGADTRLAL
jgi:hypothetical protein